MKTEARLIIFFVIGLFVCYLGYYQLQETQQLLDSGVKTTATVVDLVKRAKGTDDTHHKYSAVFRYKTQAGSAHRVTSSYASYPAPYDIGEEVEIIYNPNDPEDYKVDSFWGLYRWVIFAFFFGGMIVVISGVGYWMYRVGEWK